MNDSKFSDGTPIFPNRKNDNKDSSVLSNLLATCTSECFYSTKNYIEGLQSYGECIAEIKKQFKKYEIAILNDYIERTESG